MRTESLITFDKARPLNFTVPVSNLCAAGLSGLAQRLMHSGFGNRGAPCLCHQHFLGCIHGQLVQSMEDGLLPAYLRIDEPMVVNMVYLLELLRIHKVVPNRMHYLYCFPAVLVTDVWVTKNLPVTKRSFVSQRI
jgi:hypothetical protein